MNIMYKFCSILMLFFLMFGAYVCSIHFVVAQADPVESKLQEANVAIEQAFSAVLDAEQAGANISDLLSQLNIAAGILAQAENSYRTGDSNIAAAQANSVLPIAQEVTTHAQDAKQTALVSNKNAFWSTIAFTVIGAFFFVLVLFLVWRRFKRSYTNSISQVKPR
jgi:CHASE3 domain sensor protein